MTGEQVMELVRKDKTIRFYQHRYWCDNIRVKVLSRDNYECQECKKKGKNSRGKNVHHIIELKDDVTKRFAFVVIMIRTDRERTSLERKSFLSKIKNNGK